MDDALTRACGLSEGADRGTARSEASVGYVGALNGPDALGAHGAGDQGSKTDLRRRAEMLGMEHLNVWGREGSSSMQMAMHASVEDISPGIMTERMMLDPRQWDQEQHMVQVCTQIPLAWVSAQAFVALGHLLRGSRQHS